MSGAVEERGRATEEAWSLVRTMLDDMAAMVRSEAQTELELVEGFRVLGRVTALCAELCSGGPLALAQAKRAIDLGFGKPMPEALAAERACYEGVLGSADRNEGLRAFAEKRPPRFKGK